MKSFKIRFPVVFLFVTGAIFLLPGVADSVQVRNVVTNAATGEVLAEHKEWIYLRDKTTGEWKKLIPGKCPQWCSDGKKFFYFLDVGYDGSRAELWQADSRGEGRIRLTRSDYFVRESPVVSKDQGKLAYLYQTCMASGGFRDIVVIDLNGVKGSRETAEAKVVLRTKEEVDARSLRWIGENQLEVIVGGNKKEIDSSGKGEKQLP